MKAPEASCEDAVNLLRSWCGGTACLSSLVKKEIRVSQFQLFTKDIKK